MPVSTPAVATNATTTIVAWDAYSVQGIMNGVACRALDAAGQAITQQRSIAPDDADVVSLAALPNGTFVAVWNAALATDTEVIRAVTVQPDCSAGAPVTVSNATTGLFQHRSSVASSGDRVLFAWVVDGDLHARVALTGGGFATADAVLVAKTA